MQRLSERRAIDVMKPPDDRVLHPLDARRDGAITVQDFSPAARAARCTRWCRSATREIKATLLA
jgi:hypothetical protein